MNIMIRIITFTLLSFLASCQVKETASKSGLISDHRQQSIHLPFKVQLVGIMSLEMF